jgi:calcium-dependent protein kinase
MLELVKGNGLFEHLHRRGALSELQAGKFLHQMCSSLDHVHSLNVMHRDVKLENFVFSKRPAMKDSQLKLIDFGLSKRLDGASDEEAALGKVGSPSYVAPEVIKGERYDHSCDVWSAGVAGYAMMTGTLPFKRPSRELTEDAIKNGDVHFEAPAWDGFSKGCKDFVSKMLTTNVDQRPSMAVLLQHPWLSEMRALA